MDDMIKTGFVFATYAEAAPFVKGLNLNLAEEQPFKIYNNDNHELIISGIGKVNAAMASSYMIWKYKPSYIFNIGSCGAVRKEINVGDIYHISRIIELDRPRLSDGKLRIITPKKILDGFSSATLATQDRLVIDPYDRAEVSKYADIADMEGASVMQACKLWHVDCYLFKFVSDTAEHETAVEIQANIRTLNESMFQFFRDKVLNNGELMRSLLNAEN
jgi:nucleoside phosphorylase